MSLHRYMQMTGNTLVCPVAGHWCPADAGGNTVPSSLSLPSDWRNSRPRTSNYKKGTVGKQGLTHNQFFQIGEIL